MAKLQGVRLDLVLMSGDQDERERAVSLRNADFKAVDIWLRRDLTERYGPVLKEPLPEEWLAMLRPAPPQ